MRDPHYIWLFLILISYIPRYFVISNHQNHIIIWISKKIFSIKRNFELRPFFEKLEKKLPARGIKPWIAVRKAGLITIRPRNFLLEEEV